MKQVIYVSEYAGYNPLRTDGKSIAQFKSYPVLDAERGTVKKGVLVLDLDDPIQKAISEELEAFPDYKSGFVKVDKLPLRADSKGTITGLRTGHEEPQEELKKIAVQEQTKNEMVTKFIRIEELRKSVLDSKGAIKKSASEEEITELENLEIELGLKPSQED